MVDQGRYLHSNQILIDCLLQIKLQIIAEFKDKQSLLWCHLALDYQVNETNMSIWEHLRHRKRLKAVKIFTDFKESMVYVVHLWTIFIFL